MIVSHHSSLVGFRRVWSSAAVAEFCRSALLILGHLLQSNMSNHNIEKATVDVAIAAARDALANEPGLTWIKRSALLERAYNWGLYFGLRAITDEDSLRRLFLDNLIDTLWQREADHTFISTTIGRNYRALREKLDRDDLTSCDAQKMIENLTTSIDAQDHHWQSLVKQARNLLTEIRVVGGDAGADDNVVDEAPQKERRYKLNLLLDHLEHLAQRIALLETDHRIKKRFVQ